MVNAWSETSLPILLSNYDLKDICSTDEFGLFCQCLPNKTYELKLENCYRGKLSKIHITGMVAANSLDDKLPMSIIGKAKNSQCFKSAKFYLYLTFPLNTTSKTQPIDQGVICSFKGKYSKNVVWKLFKV